MVPVHTPPKAPLTCAQVSCLQPPNSFGLCVSTSQLLNTDGICNAVFSLFLLLQQWMVCPL